MNELITQINHKQAKSLRKMNHHLTKLIIDYHEKGYTEDFFINGNSRCLFNLRVPETCYSSYSITIVNQCFDSLSCGYRYFHLVETSCGIKGLLVSPNIQFNMEDQY